MRKAKEREKDLVKLDKTKKRKNPDVRGDIYFALTEFLDLNPDSMTMILLIEMQSDYNKR